MNKNATPGFLPESFLRKMTLLFALALTVFVLSANAQSSNRNLKKLKTFAATQQTLTYQIIPAEANTFGYDILSDNKKLIHQPSIPGMAGNHGFATKLDAEKVAKLVMNKLSHHMMPPSIEKRELDSLKVKL